MLIDDIKVLRDRMNQEIAGGITEIVGGSGANYARTRYFLKTVDAMPNRDDMLKLMRYLMPGYREGWLHHPDAPGWFYKGQEVVTEAQLRERFAKPVATSVAAE